MNASPIAIDFRGIVSLGSVCNRMPASPHVRIRSPDPLPATMLRNEQESKGERLAREPQQ